MSNGPIIVSPESSVQRLQRVELQATGIYAAIVTNRGGRTCHAAIIARELGDALIAYLQMLGTLVDFSTFTPVASR